MTSSADRTRPYSLPLLNTRVSGVGRGLSACLSTDFHADTRGMLSEEFDATERIQFLEGELVHLREALATKDKLLRSHEEVIRSKDVIIALLQERG